MATQPRQPTPTNSPAERQDMAEQLQQEKLRLEIGVLEKPFYRKIEFWSFVTTAIIAATTTFILFKNGFFDLQSKLNEEKAQVNEARRENLIHDINEFKTDTMNYNRIKDSNGSR